MKKNGALALIPIGVFVVLYLTLGIVFEYVMGISMGFYNVPIVVVFLVALLVAVLQRKEMKLDEKLKNATEYHAFIAALLEISYSEEKRAAQWKIASDAFKGVFDENTATFDMGYSGRLQSIICDLAESKVDTFFVFSNGYNTSINSNGRRERDLT